MSQTPNTAIAVIGIDIGKNSFHVVGHDARGAIVLRQAADPLWPSSSDSVRTSLRLGQDEGRQRTGKSSGAKIRSQPKLSQEQIARARDLQNDGVAWREIGALMGCHARPCRARCKSSNAASTCQQLTKSKLWSICCEEIGQLLWKRSIDRHARVALCIVHLQCCPVVWKEQMPVRVVRVSLQRVHQAPTAPAFQPCLDRS